MLQSVAFRLLALAIVTTLGVSASARGAVVLHWEMNDPTPFDDSAGGNDLVSAGNDPTFLPTGGVDNSGAYLFNGAGNNLGLTTSPTNIGPIAADWTVNFWIKTTDAAPDPTIYGVKVPVLGEPNGGPIGFTLGIENGRAGFMHYDGAWSKEIGSTLVANGIGHFVTFVHHDATNTIDFYVDGVFDASVNAHDAGAAPYNFSRLGVTFSSPTLLYAAMTLDEVTIYNTALSAAEIFEQFGPQPPVPEPGTWALVGLGAVGLAWRVRRRRNR